MHALSDSQSARAKRSDLPSATYTLADVAALLDLNYGTAWDMARAGTLPVEPIRIGRQYRFPRAVVDRLLGITDGSLDAA